jgi:hypothetical protein
MCEFPMTLFVPETRQGSYDAKASPSKDGNCKFDTLSSLVQAVIVHQAMSALTTTENAPTEARVAALKKKRYSNKNAKRMANVLAQDAIKYNDKQRKI